MRDPNRIDPMLDLLRTYWKENPDLRLGQIIANISRMSGRGADPFYMEDTAAKKVLEQMNLKVGFAVLEDGTIICSVNGAQKEFKTAEEAARYVKGIAEIYDEEHMIWMIGQLEEQARKGE